MLTKSSSQHSHSRLLSTQPIRNSRAFHLSSTSCATVQTSSRVAIGPMPWPLWRNKITEHRVFHNTYRDWIQRPLWIIRISSLLPRWAQPTTKLSMKPEARNLKAQLSHPSKAGKDSSRLISTTRATWGIHPAQMRSLGPKCSLSFHMKRFGSDLRINQSRARRP